jgi:pyruvate/2-oxoglutarate dehydrogenase complex dihydrolipoamide acyltransferase (E2) component
LIGASSPPKFVLIMRTALALFVALLGFGVTVAWSAEPAARPHASASQADAAQRAAPKARAPRTIAAPDFDKRAREAPSVICACVRSGSRA